MTVEAQVALMEEHGRRPAGLQPGGYQNLRVWKAAVDLATECYVRTARFPPWERFGLTAQMRSAAVSVVSNIAEGHGRGSTRAFGSFLAIAHGSLKELEAQVVLARRLGFLPEDESAQILSLCDGTGRMLHGLRRRVRRGESRAAASPSADARRPTADAVT